MSNFKIGGLYDGAFAKMSEREIADNLEAVAWGIEERSYTKNLTPDEVVRKKDDYAEIGLVLSEIAREKKEAAADFKFREKEPKVAAEILLSAIKFKSEQKHGKLFMVDDQEQGMMYLFDNTGVCVDARQLDKKEKQTKLKAINSNEE